MSNPDSVGYTPGSGKNVAVYDFNELAVSKILERICLNDSSGNDIASAITPVVSTAAESSHLIKNSAGIVLGCYAVNLSAMAGFLILLDDASIPSDGSVLPLAVAPLPGLGVASITGAQLSAINFSTGIVAVLTSADTPFTKTTTEGLTGFISCQAI